MPPNNPENRPAESRPTRFVMAVAAAIALSIPGDSLMYSLLPLEAAALGIPLAAVGLLLSANRIVRLLSNTWASLAFERFGPRLPFIFAALLGFITALLYSGVWGFLVFLLARAGWGIAWSAFRQGGYQAVWAASPGNRGRLMGLLWGIVRLGSAFSVLVGGYVYDRFGYQSAVLAIAAVTFLALPVSLGLRWPAVTPSLQKDRQPTLQVWRIAVQTAPRRWVLAVGFLDTFFEGVLVSTASLFLAGRMQSDPSLRLFSLGIGALAGLLLALRFTANFLFAPLLGAFSDRIGQPPAAALLASAILLGITAAVVAPGIWAFVFLTLVFFAGSGMFAVAGAASSHLALEIDRPHLFVSLYTTMIDAGAALGPLLAFTLGRVVGFEVLYIVIAALLLFASLRFWRVGKILKTHHAPISGANL